MTIDPKKLVRVNIMQFVNEELMAKLKKFLSGPWSLRLAQKKNL